jgi:uncharacterized membrane protein (DUF485 family)
MKDTIARIVAGALALVAMYLEYLTLTNFSELLDLGEQAANNQDKGINRFDPTMQRSTARLRVLPYLLAVFLFVVICAALYVMYKPKSFERQAENVLSLMTPKYL